MDLQAVTFVGDGKLEILDLKTSFKISSSCKNSSNILGKSNPRAITIKILTFSDVLLTPKLQFSTKVSAWPKEGLAASLILHFAFCRINDSARHARAGEAESCSKPIHDAANQIASHGSPLSAWTNR